MSPPFRPDPAPIRSGRGTWRRLVAAAAFWTACLTALPVHGQAPADAAPRWTRIARQLGTADAVSLADPGGKTVFSVREDLPRVPASTLKIFTVLAGFEILGPDHRFATEFLLSPGGDLKIRGYGDPMLVSEVVEDIARRLAAALGPNPAVRDLVLDDSYFAEPLDIPGVNDSLQPYDAPNGALCVNFNTVFFRRTADGGLHSAEPQTPLLPPAVERIRASGLDRGRIVLSRSRKESLLYAGHLFSYFLQAAGVQVNGKIVAGRVDPEKDRMLLDYRSPFDLEAVAARLLEYSNNFIANQVLISMGARRFGAPGTLEKGTRAAVEFARQKLGLHQLRMVEGSGISRKNRITAAEMTTVLAHFLPYRRLLVEEGPVRFKTGTLSGIQTRAGYIETPEGPYRFVVLINTPGRRADPIVRAMVESLSIP